MSGEKGIDDGLAILVSAVDEALKRCKYDGNTFYNRVGGLEGFIQLLRQDKKHGVGPKTRAVVAMVERLVMEAVVEDAASKLMVKGR